MTAACAACAVAPAAAAAARAPDGAGAGRRTLLLALPNIHCAGCIASVERALNAAPGVAEARVNLTLKRATVKGADTLSAARLVEALRRAGHEAMPLDDAALGDGADPAGRELLLALGVSGFAMMNVMLLSVSVWSGATDATRDFLHWISAAIALPAVVYAGRPFYRSALRALAGRRLNMDVPISLAIVLAALMSLYETAHSGGHAYFDAALSLTFFLLLGRYLDHRTRVAARSAAAELTALEAPVATRLTAAGPEEIRIDALAVGDRLLIAPGARAPVDAEIEEGASDVDLSVLTGEAAPEPVGPGAALPAGALNLTGPLTVRATAVGADTSLRRMAELVAVAERGRGRYASLADRAARIYAPLVHILALVAFLAWIWATGDARLAVNIAVAVLIITCPCALGLAAPAVATAAAGRLFREGVLLKSGTAMERLAEIDTVIFDKTGTLTTGAARLAGDPSDDDLARAAALAAGSRHPYARALARAAAARGLAIPPASELREVPGAGVEGLVDGRAARLGAAAWVGAKPGAGETWLAVAGAAPVRFAFADDYRPEAARVVAALRAAGVETRLLSGDGPAATEAAARALGLDLAEGGVTPAGKLDHVRALTESGRKVLMVGDGVNDVGALAAAHVSAAPGTALDAARVAADIILLKGDLAALAGSLRTARSARTRIVENFAIAAVYNVIAVPIALAGFATPLIAALAMSASSITVSLNALRVR